MGTVFRIVPSVARNWLYDYIAKNRYKWYGKKQECLVPTAELKSKFSNKKRPNIGAFYFFISN
jgi:predicted DCC family thiol-disulfide oxidoreductase YuxK